VVDLLLVKCGHRLGLFRAVFFILWGGPHGPWFRTAPNDQQNWRKVGNRRR